MCFEEKRNTYRNFAKMAHRGGPRPSGGRESPHGRPPSGRGGGVHVTVSPGRIEYHSGRPEMGKSAVFFRSHPHFERREWRGIWRPLSLTIPLFLTGAALNAFLWSEYADYFNAGWRWDPIRRLLVPPGWIWNPVLGVWVPPPAFAVAPTVIVTPPVQAAVPLAAATTAAIAPIAVFF